jgi:GT2 family glycosyltransferase
MAFDALAHDAGRDAHDLHVRLRAAGHELAYAPSAIVSHQQRLTPQSFLRQQFAYGRGAYSYRARHGSRCASSPPASTPP